MSTRAKPESLRHRPLAIAYDEVGLAGEAAFSSRYGYQVDATRLRGGDDGVDFGTYLGTVDVKTYRKPFHLLVEVGHARATFYVLARYDGAGRATLLGWADREAVERAPVSDVGKMGVQSYAIKATDLHPMTQLDRLLGAWCVGCGTMVAGERIERRPLAGEPKPADFIATCAVCRSIGWTLSPA